MNIAIVGATGNVGRKLLEVIEKLNFKFNDLHLIASDKSIGKKITHVGKSGSGQVAKACNQIVVAQTVNAISEAFIISDKFNINKNKVREALLGGFANSTALEIHGERILKSNYKPGFKTKLHAKDLRIAKDVVVKKNLKLDGVNLVNKYMNKCNKNGNSEKDSSSYYLTIKEENK